MTTLILEVEGLETLSLSLLLVENHFKGIRVGGGHLEILVHVDGAEGTGLHAQAALGATGKVVDIATQDLFARDVFGRKNIDAPVGAGPFAHAARGAVVVAVGILDHFQTATITLVHLEGLLVLGILLGDDAPWVYKILERHGKSTEQAPGTRDAAHEVALEILSCRNLFLHTNGNLAQRYKKKTDCANFYTIFMQKRPNMHIFQRKIHIHLCI